MQSWLLSVWWFAWMCVCVCVCALFLVEWPGFLSLVEVVFCTLFKNPTHALCFKIHIKTQSLFKTVECLRLLCHPTCFCLTLYHLQGMFLVQCCFPPCCSVTILLGYVAVSSICVVVMCTSLVSLLLCPDRHQSGTPDNTPHRSYGHIPK